VKLQTATASTSRISRSSRVPPSTFACTVQVSCVEHHSNKTGVAMDVETLLVHEQVRAALARYARGVDRLDLELALSAFHPGAVDHHGGTVGDPVETFPVIFERLRGHTAGSHLLGQSSITLLDEASAAVETYALGFHRVGGRDLQLGLRYVDRFEARDGDWRIVERHVVEDWRRSDPAPDDTTPGRFEAGRRDPADRSYRIGVRPAREPRG
jgi:hypothetical protein